MADEQEPKGKMLFSKQALDTLTSAEPELGEKLGAALRDIMQNPTQESPTRRRSTARIREEDIEQFREMGGQRIVGYYHEIPAHPPFFLTTFYMAMLFTKDKHLFLQGLDEEVMKRLGYPRDEASDEEKIAANDRIDLTFEGIEERDEGVVVKLRRENGEVEGVFASHYALMQRPDDMEEEELAEEESFEREQQ